jgi:hypothetical protein
VRAVVEANGGDAELARCHAALVRLLPERASAVVIESAEGEVEATYQSLLASLD